MTTESYIHRTAPGKPGAPLAFLFHGTGGDENQLIQLGRDLLPDATLVAPRGDVAEHGAARFFRRRAEGLYDMADLARATDKMISFIETMIAELKPSRVIGLGYSNGANILANVIFTRRALFDAAVLMHPLIGWEPEPGPVATSVLITAGQRDPIAPAPLARQLEDWFRAQGAPTSAFWHEGGHGVETAELVAIGKFLEGAHLADTGPAR